MPQEALSPCVFTLPSAPSRGGSIPAFLKRKLRLLGQEEGDPGREGVQDSPLSSFPSVMCLKGTPHSPLSPSSHQSQRPGPGPRLPLPTRPGNGAPPHQEPGVCSTPFIFILETLACPFNWGVYTCLTCQPQAQDPCGHRRVSVQGHRVTSGHHHFQCKAKIHTAGEMGVPPAVPAWHQAQAIPRGPSPSCLLPQLLPHSLILGKQAYLSTQESP